MMTQTAQKISKMSQKLQEVIIDFNFPDYGILFTISRSSDEIFPKLKEFLGIPEDQSGPHVAALNIEGEK